MCQRRVLCVHVCDGSANLREDRVHSQLVETSGPASSNSGSDGWCGLLQELKQGARAVLKQHEACRGGRVNDGKSAGQYNEGSTM